MPSPRARRRSELHNVVKLRVTPSAPNPGDKLVHPWRFKVGEWVHVRSSHFRPTQTLQVLSGELINSFPHYTLQAVDGTKWRISQLRLGLDPITER